MKNILFPLFLLFPLLLLGQNPGVIIPVPSHISLSKGIYKYEDQPKVKTEVGCRNLDEEEYVLEITGKGIKIKAGGEAGAFYALQSLAQMTSDGKVRQLQCCVIKDSPRFPYRGLHVDVSRHFRSVDFLKKQMDAMALLKMNKMHIHLTDAAGWRIEIEKYPRLTEFAAWRQGHTWKEWIKGGSRYVDKGTEEAYGGYYTKEDVAELLEYAAARHIEIIPEIEMPSHSEEVLAAYPELGCSGKPYKDSDFCVGKEEVFVFLENVLSEVIEMFPSEYIHIGGDEASKKHWKTCPDCQRRMKEEGLDNVDELQSYMIRRIERFVNSKGRKIIGWDEILQGGLAPEATVMSWRGTQGGIEAMNQGHDVIMSPGRYCYLDHTQDAPFKEPESIGGYLPLDSVYRYEPVEASMKKEKLHHLLGVQANLWSEYITTDEHAEYMYWPRAAAVAEIAWSRPEDKDQEDFRRRVLNLSQLLVRRGYEVFDISKEYGERKQSVKVMEHKAKGKPVKYAISAHEWYPASGDVTLTDGVIGGWTYSDKRWQGFLSDMDVTVDLQQVDQINYIGATFMQLKGPGVYMPERVEISVSEDGVTFSQVAVVWNDVRSDNTDLMFKDFHTICEVKARYIRIYAVRSPNRGFMFTDEIVVN